MCDFSGRFRTSAKGRRVEAVAFVCCGIAYRSQYLGTRNPMGMPACPRRGEMYRHFTLDKQLLSICTRNIFYHTIRGRKLRLEIN